MKLTEKQYTELRKYEDGLPRMEFLPSGGAARADARLLDNGLIAHKHDQLYAITGAGLQALADFRARYGLPAGV